ncbi:heparinase II/III family protein [Neiella sp. HB171785]|uniref:Heparinase II/III family protein n=1 Tax=Neiella litorisoli TaxID=2771431 RepID=A0A8J6QIK6_9GAMM|nr:heparinase II/III family protein [Neiella litorisoli]MBD1388661.1 heparinase II/III family protein [Neiella litorisoli]
MNKAVLSHLAAVTLIFTAACTPNEAPPNPAKAAPSETEAAVEMERPFIWVKADERQQILNKIEQQDWAQQLFTQLKSRADKAAAKDLAERKDKLLALPLEWPDGENSAPTLVTYAKSKGNHSSDKLRWGNPREPQLAMLNGVQNGVDCGVMFYLTEQQQYAQCAADMLSLFVNALAKTKLGPESSKDGARNSGWLYQDNHLLEARVLGAQLPIIYDFVYNWLNSGGKVVDLASDQLVSFDFDAAQQVFNTYVELALNRGLLDSNWPVLESSSLVHNIHALDDPAAIERLLPFYLDTNTEHQASLKMVAEMFPQAGDIWPESLSYSRHVTSLSIYLMTLMDRIYPELKLGQRYPNIPQSLTAMYNLQFPNDAYPYNGDTHRHMAIEYQTYEMALVLARLNDNQQQAEQFGQFLAASVANGNYHRDELEPRHYAPSPYVLPLQLLWSSSQLVEPGGEQVAPMRPRTNHLPYAGMTVQRNIAKTGVAKDGLMAVVSGGSYIHGHATGMDLELYGQGYVLGIDGGKWTYGTDIHENYYRLFAAHNSVISNGASASKGGWINLGIEQVQTEAIEPDYEQPAVSELYSFATTSFNDGYNLVAPAEHQRTLALIRLSDTQGYYLDVFRARSDTPEQFHDYVYHNVADQLSLTSDNSPLPLQDDSERYQQSASLHWQYHKVYRHPGWHFFEQVKSGAPTTQSMTATFRANKLAEQPIVMRAIFPAGPEAQLTQVLAPQSKSAPRPYDKKPLPTVLMRRHGEAWTNPFVTVYESHTEQAGEQPAVQAAERLLVNGEFKGVKVSVRVAGQAKTQYILLQQDLNDEYINDALGIRFRGRFAVITVDAEQTLEHLYIGSGRSLQFQRHELRPQWDSTAAFKRF